MENNKQDTTTADILDDLDELDKVIIRYKLEGLNNNDIAIRTEKHRETIAKRLKKVKVRQALNELQKTALQILLDSQSDAARELKRQLKHGETDRDKREAAKEILKGVLSDSVNLTGESELSVKLEFVDSKEKENG